MEDRTSTWPSPPRPAILQSTHSRCTNKSTYIRRNHSRRTQNNYSREYSRMP
ncbi:hypothetical protein ID866_11334 [Astraeus odoratus]|nr:hypothetical protein ID866_11334 [Astraeus odoratus]